MDENVMQDCCQLVKANSIKGNKKNNVDVVCSPGIYSEKISEVDLIYLGIIVSAVTYIKRERSRPILTSVSICSKQPSKRPRDGRRSGLLLD